jgi:hypothetical protein
MFGHHVTINKAPISDWVGEIHRSWTSCANKAPILDKGKLKDIEGITEYGDVLII